MFAFTSFSRFTAIGLVALACAAHAASAGSVLDTFHATPPGYVENDPLRLDSAPAGRSAAAVRFSAYGAAPLTRVRIAMNGLAGASAAIVRLHAHAIDRPAESSLGAWQLPVQSSGIHTLDIPTDQQIVLNHGETYWLSIATPGIGVLDWFRASAGSQLVSTRIGPSGPWGPATIVSAPAIRIEMKDVCPPGLFSPTGFPPCASCPAGTFSNVPGATACTPCVAGTFSLIPGAAACVACPAGKFAPEPGATDCLPCPAGTFNAVSGASVCIPCPPGRYSLTPGSTTCPACSEGSFSPAPGFAACLVCPPGFFQPVAQSTGCFSCPLQQFQPDPAQTNCLSCQQSTYAFTSGATLCQPCPPGLTCTGQPCPLGMYRPTPISPCEACPAAVLTIQSEPADTTAVIGSRAILNITVPEGQGPMAFVWIRDGAPLSPSPRFMGVRGNTLIIDDLMTADAGEYRVLVSNSCSFRVTAPAVLSVAACRADVNASGALSVQDIFDFLAAYFSHDPLGDFNLSDTFTVQDIFDFLAAYFVGCA